MIGYLLALLGAGGLAGALYFIGPAAMLAMGRAALASAGRWLTSRSLIELACIALAIFAGIQTLRLSDAQSDVRKWKANAEKAHSELRRISTVKNDQRNETERNIGKAHEKIREVQVIKERILKAPNPPGCATPPEVLQADL